MNVPNALLYGLGSAILLPMLVWSAECLVALLPNRRNSHAYAYRPTIAVLVPAHNEAAGIRITLDSVRAQLLAHDRLVVIADNCTDDTARISRDRGASVLERNDPEHRGKSYALHYAAQALATNPPEVFVVIDADCEVPGSAIDVLARKAVASNRPVQAAYSLKAQAGQSPRGRIAELAFLIKNVVRPSGLARLGLPCFLNGSGMAFPSSILGDSILANGKIAEDRWLTIDLACAGHVAAFCRESKITSRLSLNGYAHASQATRWLHGHLECMLAQGPRLLAVAIRRRRIDLFGLFLDLSVPPISLLLLLWIGVMGATVMAGVMGGNWRPAILPAAGAGFMSGSFVAVVLKRGDRGTLRALASAPAFVLARIPLYINFVFRRERNWIRTDRDTTPPEPSKREAELVDD